MSAEPDVNTAGAAHAAFALAQILLEAVVKSGVLTKQDAERRLREAIAGNKTGGPVNKKAAAMLPEVCALLDKGAKTHLLHASTANRLKSRLALTLHRLQTRAAA